MFSLNWHDHDLHLSGKIQGQEKKKKKGLQISFTGWLYITYIFKAARGNSDVLQGRLQPL